jgi:hypothetical protein
MEFDTDISNECPIAPNWIDIYESFYDTEIEKNGIPKERP